MDEKGKDEATGIAVVITRREYDAMDAVLGAAFGTGSTYDTADLHHMEEVLQRWVAARRSRETRPREWKVVRQTRPTHGVLLLESDADGKVWTTVSPAESLKVRGHSPTGFETGYEGSGPAQLALAIMLRYFGHESGALDWYQAFKRWKVAPNGDGFTVTEDEIAAWIAGYGKEEAR